MRTFATKLDEALTRTPCATDLTETAQIIMEMAELAGWHPTDRLEHNINYQGKTIGVADGANPQQAITNFIKDDPELIKTIAAQQGVDTDQFISALTAALTMLDDLKPYDITSINSEETRKTIEDWFNNNPTPYRWIIHFGKDYSIRPTPGYITFVKYGNAGRDKLTPHMIMHTAGHALVASQELGYLASDLNNWISETYGTRLGEDRAVHEICKFLHMKAAKYTLAGNAQRGFPSMIEVVNELAGIYIKHGKIKIAPNKHCDHEVDPAKLKQLQNYLERTFNDALARSLGELITDD